MRLVDEVLPPFRETPLVQVQTDGIHLIDGSIKGCFEVAVSTERFFDMTGPATFGPKLNRLKVLDIFSVEEQVPNRRRLFVNLARVTGQNDTFGYYPERIARCQSSRSDQID